MGIENELNGLNWTCFFSLTVYIFIRPHIYELNNFFYWLVDAQNIFLFHHIQYACAALHSPWYGVLTCWFSLPGSLSITCLLSAQKLIHLLIIHSLSMSSSDSASNLLLLRSQPPSLSSSVASLVFDSHSVSPRNLARTDIRIQNCWAAVWMLLSWCHTNGQADKQSSVGEEWRWW